MQRRCKMGVLGWLQFVKVGEGLITSILHHDTNVLRFGSFCQKMGDSEIRFGSPIHSFNFFPSNCGYVLYVTAGSIWFYFFLLKIVPSASKHQNIIFTSLKQPSENSKLLYCKHRFINHTKSSIVNI